MNQPTYNFIGCEASFEQADIVMFGAPFDGTTSYRPGTRFAPSAIRNESFGIETYSPYQDQDLLDYNVMDAGDLEFPFGNPRAVLNLIEKTTSEILEANKLPMMIGGEHLVTLGTVEAVFKKYPNLAIVHFDAHADLRADYMEEELSHATVMRRIHDLVGDNSIYQFGIRSGDKEEFEFAKNHVVQNKFNTNGIENIVKQLEGRPVYFTIDLDIVDPAYFSGTGTPEAGGINFNELLNAIQWVAKCNIVGMDVNELSPMYDQSGASTAFACKTIRELLLAVLKEKNNE